MGSRRCLRPSPKNRIIAAAPACWYPATVVRHSSGSSRAVSIVEPTRSQNRIVRCRRSPDTSAVWIDGAIATAGSTGALSGVRHLPQKFALGEVSAPHFAQTPLKEFPQWTQKLFPIGVKLPQFAQCIRYQL